jgi:aspartyl protease family protein
MLSWALRYLAMAVAVGCGFALLQGPGSAWLEGASSIRAAPPGMGTKARSTGPGDYYVDAGAGGHFVIDAIVNGVPISFLVDTGASDVVLTLDDAEAVGFEPRSLDFSRRYHTANGVVRAAPVVLREVRIGQQSLYDVDAAVNQAPISISLLGMSFLDRLAGYEVDSGRLVLRW